MKLSAFFIMFGISALTVPHCNATHIQKLNEKQCLSEQKNEKFVRDLKLLILAKQTSHLKNQYRDLLAKEEENCDCRHDAFYCELDWAIMEKRLLHLQQQNAALHKIIKYRINK